MQSNPLNSAILTDRPSTVGSAGLAPPQDYLSKELENEKVMQALNSAEGVPDLSSRHETQNTKQTNINKERSKSIVPDNVWKVLVGIASHFHLLVGLNGSFNFFSKSFSKTIDKLAPKVSKVVNLFNYTDKGQLSLRDNNSLDGLSKFLFPAIVTWFPVDDMFLAQGLSSGTTMLASAHNPRVNDKTDFMANLKQHWNSYKEMLSETFRAGGIKKLLSKDDFHLMHLGGNMNFFGGLGGLIADSIHPIIKTGFSVVRNMGGVVCDIAKILHGDVNYRVSGALYIAAHGLDMWQAAISSDNNDKSRVISHYVQWLSTIANYFYIKPSETMANNEFKDRVKDQRMAYAMG
jgi:hypothetical protein